MRGGHHPIVHPVDAATNNKDQFNSELQHRSIRQSRARVKEGIKIEHREGKIKLGSHRWEEEVARSGLRECMRGEVRAHVTG
jgi:hypothetical protein